MKSQLNMALISAVLFFSLPSPANAAHHGDMQHSPELKQALQRSNFMPPLMRFAMQNRDTLNLSTEQVRKLKVYKQENSPAQQQAMKDVVNLENQANEAALGNRLADAKTLGMESIELRESIFKQKVACHRFVKSTLTPAQFNELLKLASRER